MTTKKADKSMSKSAVEDVKHICTKCKNYLGNLRCGLQLDCGRAIVKNRCRKFSENT